MKSWQDTREGCTLTPELSLRVFNPDTARNCHPSVSHAGLTLHEYPSSIRGMLNWRTSLLALLICERSISNGVSWRVGELSLAPRMNYKFLPKSATLKCWAWTAGSEKTWAQNSLQSTPKDKNNFGGSCCRGRLHPFLSFNQSAAVIAKTIHAGF